LKKIQKTETKTSGADSTLYVNFKHGQIPMLYAKIMSQYIIVKRNIPVYR